MECCGFLVYGVEIDADSYKEKEKFKFLRDYVEENDIKADAGRIYKSFYGEDVEDNNGIAIFGASIASDDGDGAVSFDMNYISDSTKNIENNLQEIFKKIEDITGEKPRYHMILEQYCY